MLSMGALTAFFLGQISVVILFFAFIKFFIFGESSPTKPQRPHRHSHSSSYLSSNSKPFSSASRTIRRKKSSAFQPHESSISLATILAKTFYNVRGHQPESLDWFNVLVAQALAQLRVEALHDDALHRALTGMLNARRSPSPSTRPPSLSPSAQQQKQQGVPIPEYVGPITLTELSLGDQYPIFSNCRIIPVDEAGNAASLPPSTATATARDQSAGSTAGTTHNATRLLARLDVDLSDALTLGIETKLRWNYPLWEVLTLPTALTVEVLRFSGTINLSFMPSDQQSQNNNNSNPISNSDSAASPGPITLAFSFLPDYRLELSVCSLLGSRAKLQDVPKIAQLVEARIHAWMADRCVEPRYQQIVLPGIWPRKQNARGGEQDDGEFAATAAAEESELDRQLREDSLIPQAQAQARASSLFNSPINNLQQRKTKDPENMKIPGQI